MSPEMYDVVETFLDSKQEFDVADYTDRIDASLTESLGEYGFIRNPITNEVIHTHTGYNEENNPDITFHRTRITTTEVRDAIADANDGFFSYADLDREKELAILDAMIEKGNKENYFPELAHLIHSLQSYDGAFWTSSN